MGFEGSVRYHWPTLYLSGPAGMRYVQDLLRETRREERRAVREAIKGPFSGDANTHPAGEI